MSGSNDLLGDLVAEAQQGARGETGALVLLERETEMRNLSKKAKTIIAGAAIAGLTSTGVAYAYWTTTGHGAGEATTGTTANADKILLVQNSAIADLYPGGPAGHIMVTAHNPAAFDQVVGEVTVVVATYPAGCPASNWTLTNDPDAFGNIAAGDTSAAIDVGNITLDETGLNQDLCKSVTPTFDFSSAGGE